MMKTSYRLMTESEIKQIRKGDTLYLDAEFKKYNTQTQYYKNVPVTYS